MQGMIDFDTPESNPYTPEKHYAPETDTAHTLTIKLDKGKSLGNPLRKFVSEAVKDTKAKKGDVFIHLDRDGIHIVNADLTMQYPIGVIAQGNGDAVLRAEALYRMLIPTPTKPSWIKSYEAYPKGIPASLGDQRTEIKINGKCEVKTGNFTATLATRENPMK